MNGVLCTVVVTALRLLALVTGTVGGFVGLDPGTSTLQRGAALPRGRFEPRAVGAALEPGVLRHDVGLAPAPPQPRGAVRLAPVPRHLQEDGLPP